MSVTITVLGIPAEVQRALTVRAARFGLSLEEYLRAELARLASVSPARGSVADVRRGTQDHPRLRMDDIVRAVESGRR